jgi:hypothetical protein
MEDPLKPFTDTAQILNKLIPEDYLTAIGRVVVQWSLMEAMLEGLIWQSLRVRNDLGRTVTAQLQAMSKLDLLCASLWQTKPKLAGQMESVARYVNECLRGQRNAVAHGMWTAPMNRALPIASIIKFSAKGRLTTQERYFASPTELDDIATKIGEVTAWLIEFGKLLPKLRQRRGGLGHKTPEPPPPQSCATRRKLSLQPPTAHPIAPPPPKRKRRKRPEK